MSMQLALLSLYPLVILFFLQRNKQSYRLASITILSIGILFAYPVLYTHAQSAPYNGSARAIPGTIQAEDYDTGGEGVSYHDSTDINVGGVYRTSEAVDMEAAYDTGGGYTVGWTTDGEWVQYTVNVQTTDSYSIDARVGTQVSGKTLGLSLDGASIGTLPIPNTGGWQTWQTTAALTNIRLTAGQHVLRLTMNTGSTSDTTQGFNINYIRFTSAASGSNTPPSANAGTDQSIVLPTSSASLSGSGTDTDGSIASYAWSQQFGPNTATIASANSASTTVSNLIAGSYRFRLTVTDNGGATGYDDVNIVVGTTNTPPPTGSSPIIPINAATMVINENVVGDETKLFNEQNTLQLDGSGNPTTSSTNPVFCPDVWNEVKGHITCYSLFDNNGVHEISWPAHLTIDLKATYSVSDAYVYIESASANGTVDALEIRASDDPFKFTNKVGGSKLVGTYPYNQWIRIPLTTNNNRYLQLTITSDAGKIGEIVFTGTKTGATVSEDNSAGTWQKQHYTMDTFIGTNVSFGMGDGYDKDYDYQWGTLRNYGGFRWTFDLNDNVVPNAYASDTELRRIASGSGVKSFNAQMGAAQNMVDPADPNYNNTGDSFADRKPIDYTLCKGTVTVNGVASCKGVADKPASYAHKAYLDKKYAQYIGSSSVYKQEFVELGNESDGSWNQAGYFNPYELAAMMSADYDGHCDTMRYNGEHVGIKAGDPNMKVMMPGLVSMGSGDMRYLKAMYFWWEHNRPCAQKVPADVINFHFYASTSGGQGNITGYGESPEDYGMRDMMKKTVDFRNKYAPNADVAVTEYGYDSYPQVFPDPTVSWCKDSVYGGSIIAARPVASYDSDEVAGQWIARTILEMAAAGIDFSNQFWLGDEYKINTVCGTFAASGLLKQPVDAINWRPQYQPRPGWYYVQTLRTQLKGMKYESDKKVNGISVMKFRDTSDRTKVAYAVWSPTATGYTNNSFTLNFDQSGTAKVVKLAVGNETGQVDQSTSTGVSSIVVPVSERPIIVAVTEGATVGSTLTVNAGVDQSIALPTTGVTLTGTATVSTGTITSYQWTKVAGGAATITSPSAASTTVSGLAQGTYTFRLLATDSSGATVSDDVNVTVSARPNTAPAVNAGVDQTITLPVNSVSLTGTAVDVDNDSMTYVWTKTAGGVATIASPSSLTSMISGLTQGTYTFVLTVTDSQGASGSDTITVLVNGATNVAPVANAGTDQTIAKLSGSFTLTGSGTDADGSIASYRWTQVSGPTATIVSSTATSTKVNATSTGVYIFRLTVTDNLGAVGTDDVSVTAQSVKINKNPHVKAAVTSPITTTASTLKLSGTATDEDGTIATTEWTQVSGPQASIASPTSLETDIAGLDTGTYEFTLTATDNEGGVATDTVRVIASRPASSGGGGGGGSSSGGGSNRTDSYPTVSAGGDQTISLPLSTVALNGSGADAEGNVSFSWSQSSGPRGAKITNSSSAKTTVTGLVEGRYIFSLSVTDKKGQRAIDQSVVIVLPATTINVPSVANSNRIKINVQTTLRVRSEASITGTVIGTVRGGMGGIILQEKTGPSGINWIQAQFDNGTTGWVSKSYTVPDQSVTITLGNINNGSTRATVIAKLLNVRSAAGGMVIGKVTSGNGGVVLADTGSWLQIRFDNGTTGWVFKAYTKIIGETPPVDGLVTVTATSLNVRTIPGGQIIGKVSFGTQGTKLGESAGWIHVQFPMITGWVSVVYVR